MTLSTPSSINSLPNSVTVDVTAGLDTHLIAVYDYLKDLAGEINAEIASLITDANAVTPAGSMKLYGGTSAPTGWLFCRGQAVSRATYATLFAAIGTAFGAGDGSTTFNLPNMQGKFPVGLHPSGDTDYDTIGETGGSKTVTLTSSEIPSHSHAAGSLTTASDAHEHTFTGKGDASTTHSHNQTNTAATGGTSDSTNGTITTGSDSHTHAISGNTATAGSGGAHSNMPPFVTLNYLIKI